MGRELEREFGTAVQTEKPKLQKPPMYNVVLLNDDYTPMDFVVEILTTFFSLDIEKATRVMLQVHHEGKGVCGTFRKEIAETKVVQVNQFARSHEHPLMCVMEKATS